MDTRGEEIVRANKALIGKRDLYKNTWDSVGDYLNIQRQEGTSEGANRMRKVYSTAAIKAHSILVAGLYSLLTSPTIPWFSLKMRDRALKNNAIVKGWLESSSEDMYSAFARSTLYNVIAEFYADISSYSIGGIYIEEGRGKPLNFITMSPYDFVYGENSGGIIDTVYRTIYLTARQASEQFNLETLNDTIKEIMSSNGERQDVDKFSFVHAITPRKQRDTSKVDNLNFPFACEYVDEKSGEVVDTSGFNEFPCAIARWEKNSKEAYGMAPGIMALPDIKTANVRKKNMLIQEEKIINPPLDVPAGYKGRINTMPGGINVGPGNGDRIQKLDIAGRLDVSAEMLQYDIQQINDMFFVDVFMMFRQIQRQMTAYEVSKREAEQMNMFGPVIGRLINECLENLIVRSFSIMLRGGYFQDPPMEVQGQEYDIEYISPLARALKAAQGNNLQAALSFVVPFAQYYPDILDGINPDEVLEYVFDLYGCPTRIRRDPEERDALREQRDQMKAAEAALAGMGSASGSLKDLAAADKDGFLKQLTGEAQA